MSTRQDPRSYSERELTLRAISITSQRARAVQRRLTAMRGGQDLDPDRRARETREPSLLGGDGLHLDDMADDDMADDDLDEEVALPNPMITDNLLRHHLEQATIHQGQDQSGWRGLIDRALAPTRLHHQAHFNTTIVHALHQLDHRSQLQGRTLAELEAETAALRRALSDLESRFHHQP